MIKLAFRNPYLVIVFEIMVIVMSSVLILRTPIDILLQNKKPAVELLAIYSGMPVELVAKGFDSRVVGWTRQSPSIEKQLTKSIIGVSVVNNQV